MKSSLSLLEMTRSLVVVATCSSSLLRSSRLVTCATGLTTPRDVSTSLPPVTLLNTKRFCCRSSMGQSPNSEGSSTSSSSDTVRHQGATPMDIWTGGKKQQSQEDNSSKPDGNNKENDLSKEGGGELSYQTIQLADIAWSAKERMDFYLKFRVPSTWYIREKVKENMISIECFPSYGTTTDDGAAPRTDPITTRPSTMYHGCTISSYAYHKKVSNPDPEKLMHAFLRRFDHSVNNTLEVIESHYAAADSAQVRAERVNSGLKRKSVTYAISDGIGGCVCELTFQPPGMMPGSSNLIDCEKKTSDGGRVKGLCRAFFGVGKRFHYVVMCAVPEDEYVASREVIAQTVMAVTDYREDRE